MPYLTLNIKETWGRPRIMSPPVPPWAKSCICPCFYIMYISYTIYLYSLYLSRQLSGTCVHYFSNVMELFKDRKVLLWFTLVLTYVLTYILTYLRTSHLPGNSSYTKTLLTKNVPNDTSPCSKFFFWGRNPKNDRGRVKNPLFWPKNAVYLFFLKKSSS